MGLSRDEALRLLPWSRYAICPGLVKEDDFLMPVVYNDTLGSNIGQWR